MKLKGLKCILLLLLVCCSFCLFISTPVSANTINANPSYIWATYRNLDNPSDSFVDHVMCNSQQTCSNPFPMLANNRYQVYGLVVDTPLNFTTLSYGSAKYSMYIWSGGQNLGGSLWGDTAQEYSDFFDATMSGTLRDGSLISVNGSCSRTWQDVHQIKLECYYQNLPANTNFNITTVRFGHSSLSTSNHPIFENNPSLSGGIIYISNYEFNYATSNSAESAYLQEVVNQNNTIINQNQQIINNQQETTDAIEQQTDWLKDDTAPDVDVNSALADSAGWLPAGPVDSILTLPIAFMQGIVNVLTGSDQCQPISAPLPFVGGNLVLPCMRPILNQMGFLAIYEIVGGVVSMFIIWNTLKWLYEFVDKTLSFREDNSGLWGGL